MMFDVIADMLTRIRNALAVAKPQVEMPFSKIKGEISRVLKQEGYIQDFSCIEEGNKKQLRIDLKYHAERPVIAQIDRVSRPGLRRYVKKTDIRPVLGGLGITILTTPQGVMVGSEAIKRGIGGEILCRVL